MSSFFPSPAILVALLLPCLSVRLWSSIRAWRGWKRLWRKDRPSLLISYNTKKIHRVAQKVSWPSMIHNWNIILRDFCATLCVSNRTIGSVHLLRRPKLSLSYPADREVLNEGGVLARHWLFIVSSLFFTLWAIFLVAHLFILFNINALRQVQNFAIFKAERLPCIVNF